MVENVHNYVSGRGTHTRQWLRTHTVKLTSAEVRAPGSIFSEPSVPREVLPARSNSESTLRAAYL